MSLTPEKKKITIDDFIDNEIISRELARGMIEPGRSPDDNKLIQSLADEIEILTEILNLIEHCPEPRTEEERRKFINKWWPKWKDIGAGKGLTSRYINEMIDELDRREK